MASSVATPLEYQFAQISGRGADDLDQRARHDRRSRCSSTSTATSTPPRRTCSRRSTPPAASCRRTCRAPPTYRKINPADSPILISAVHSDALPITTVDDYAENILAQQISQIAGRRAGHHRRPAEAGGARAGRPGEARGHGAAARGRARTSSPTATVDAPKGSINGPTPQLHHLRQRPAAEGRALERRHRRLPQRRAGPHPRHRRRGRRAREHPAGGLAERQAAASCC